MQRVPEFSRGDEDAAAEANARLTGGAAAVLLVLLVAEGATILNVRRLLGAHVRHRPRAGSQLDAWPTPHRSQGQLRALVGGHGDSCPRTPGRYRSVGSRRLVPPNPPRRSRRRRATKDARGERRSGMCAGRGDARSDRELPRGAAPQRGKAPRFHSWRTGRLIRNLSTLSAGPHRRSSYWNTCPRALLVTTDCNGSDAALATSRSGLW